MKKTLYLYDDEIINYNFGKGHPMKPLKVGMTHALVTNYDLHKHMDVIKPLKASYKTLLNFHNPEYIKFLSTVNEENIDSLLPELNRFNVKEDCPVFPGLFDYCKSVAGATIMAASKLNTKEYETVINWSGGFHHAKVSEASGFCYVNDIVLGILELLKIHNRVLYIDIDVHHGDGVEEAFYTSERVLTLSFHKFGEFFPGTGHIDDIGIDKGKNYAVNVPLKDGIDDISYESIFSPIVTKIMDQYQPEAVFMQCGADSLSGDKLGCFNLTEKGHGKCVEYVKSFNLPTIIVGGGGYTIENVSKAWAYDTGAAIGIKIDDDIPYNEYLNYYSPNFKIKIPKMNVENMNTKEDMDLIIQTIFTNLKDLDISPSVEMSVTPSIFNEFDVELDEDKDDDELFYKKVMNDVGLLNDSGK